MLAVIPSDAVAGAVTVLVVAVVALWREFFAMTKELAALKEWKKEKQRAEW